MGLSVFPAASTGAKTYSFYVDAKAYATASSTVPAGVYSYTPVAVPGNSLNSPAEVL